MHKGTNFIRISKGKLNYLELLRSSCLGRAADRVPRTLAEGDRARSSAKGGKDNSELVHQFGIAAGSRSCAKSSGIDIRWMEIAVTAAGNMSC